MTRTAMEPRGHLSLVRANRRTVYSVDRRLSKGAQKALIGAYSLIECEVLWAMQEGKNDRARSLAMDARALVKEFGDRL